jgi:type II secretory ATPase GspE/PulE/Tfp pilus assembly ATPase PilB-like protein
LEIVREAIKRPYGLILITGPTGSGKSTTLYSMMNELDKEKSNIVSLEDPVEYHMPDINQSQMMPEIGYTFASGLRSILRQDPDVIMVGEIRDKETAQLAIQAALTGHLVLIHPTHQFRYWSDSSIGGYGSRSISDCADLDCFYRPAFGKMTCPSSRKLVPMDESIKMQIEKQLKDLPEEYKKEIEIKDEMYDTVPVSECPTGTRGRIAIFEMFKINKKVQEIILKNPTRAAILYEEARRNGMLTMREDAMLKAINGIIPYREVYGFTNEGE